MLRPLARAFIEGFNGLIEYEAEQAVLAACEHDGYSRGPVVLGSDAREVIR